MSVVRFKPNVGRTVYRGSVAMSSEADFGASIKAQMDQIVQNFRGMVESIEVQKAQILEDALLPTFDKSQDIVPVKTGDLRLSGYLEMRDVRGNAQVEIGYARGGDPPYAVFVHEDIEAQHESPTQAKFLQQPLEEDAEQIAQIIRDELAMAAGIA